MVIESATSCGILPKLKLQTRAAHSDLECSLQLLSPPIEQRRFVAVLERFYGFHASWEAHVARFQEFCPMLRERSRLGHLSRDLKALGSDISRLAVCEQTQTLAVTKAAALGSLYVLEGSTLGGRVITTAISGASWLPAHGLSYFDPYGRETGAMWRIFKQWFEAQVIGHSERDIINGAQSTFSVLRSWLCR